MLGDLVDMKKFIEEIGSRIAFMHGKRVYDVVNLYFLNFIFPAQLSRAIIVPLDHFIQTFKSCPMVLVKIVKLLLFSISLRMIYPA
ncbi:Uncharacterised protein [uncultured archaeon]|nr:Uncharacterised protein [uncultured archaeon]